MEPSGEGYHAQLAQLSVQFCQSLYFPSSQCCIVPDRLLLMGEGEKLIHTSLILPFPPHSQHGSIKVGSDDFSNFKENPYTSSCSKSCQCSLL